MKHKWEMCDFDYGPDGTHEGREPTPDGDGGYGARCSACGCVLPLQREYRFPSVETEYETEEEYERILAVLDAPEDQHLDQMDLSDAEFALMLDCENCQIAAVMES